MNKIMKLAYFVVGFYFSFLKKYKGKGLEASVFILTVPYVFIFVGILFYISQYVGIIRSFTSNPLLVGLLMLITLFTTHRILTNIYLPKYDDLNKYIERLGFLGKVVLPIVGILFFYLSIILFFYSFKYI